MRDYGRLGPRQTLELSLFRLYRDSQIRRHRLSYLFWEATLRCNLSCLHCGSDCLKDSGQTDMPIEDFLAVLDSLKARGMAEGVFVCITGGEPLLRQDLERAGALIGERGFTWGLVSNGTLLDRERFMALRRAGLSSLSLSLDGLETEHNRLRGGSRAFAPTLRAIELAAAAYHRRDGLLGFDVISCAHKGNLGQLGELCGLLEALGVPAWRIFSVFPTGRARVGDGLSLDQAERRALFDFIAANRPTAKMRIEYSCEGFLGAYERRVRDYYYFCRAGINTASVMCDGSVGGCLSIRSPDFVQGSIYKRDFCDIWEAGFANMRDRSWSRRGPCAACRHWAHCLGGPLHLHSDASSPPLSCCIPQ